MEEGTSAPEWTPLGRLLAAALAVALVLGGLAWWSSRDGGDEPQAAASDTSTTTDPPRTTERQPVTTETIPSTTTTQPVVVESVVIYEVTGSGSAQVTYGTSGFSQEQHTVTLPWRHEIRGDVPEYPVLVAQLQNSGEISCKIWGGGEVPMAEATSSGAYAVVTCADN